MFWTERPLDYEVPYPTLYDAGPYNLKTVAHARDSMTKLLPPKLPLLNPTIKFFDKFLILLLSILLHPVTVYTCLQVYIYSFSTSISASLCTTPAMPASAEFQKATAAVKKFTKEPSDDIKLQVSY